MIKYDSCIRCNSKNIDKVYVNKFLDLTYPEKKVMGKNIQKIINPTDAIVCKDCGHIELFVDYSKFDRPL